jgi:hypothetical protein
VHRELLSQFVAAKALETCEVMSSWIPVRLISEFVGQLLSSYVIDLIGYNQLCREFLLARMLISKNVDESVEGSLNEVINMMKQANGDGFRRGEERLKGDSELYEILDHFS